jgi:hypothetical protein
MEFLFSFFPCALFFQNYIRGTKRKRQGREQRVQAAFFAVHVEYEDH